MIETSLYPLKFEIIPKEKIWGGTRLRELLDKDIKSEKCGESWELSTVDEDISIVENGILKGKKLTDLIDKYKGLLVGNKVYEIHKNSFPLLVKFIDANSDLSIQVHPNDDQAFKKHRSRGKNEMWYIVHADERAKLIAGFEQKADKDSFRKHLNENTLKEILHEEQVFKGDVFFIPAGTIHNIGAGMLIAEIQQASDITYRIHDYNRTDLTGEPRELHIDDALEVLNYEQTVDAKTKYEPALNELVNLVKCPFFTTNKLNFDTLTIRDFLALDSFVVYICLSGEVNLTANDHQVTLKKGDVYLVPAVIDTVMLAPNSQSLLLEVYIE
jgi:mannose-6-phosphate isomerase